MVTVVPPRMYVSIHRVIASRLGFMVIFLLVFILLVVQWQFHTFTTLTMQEHIYRELDPKSDARPTNLIIKKLKDDQESSKQMITSLNRQILDLKNILETKKRQLSQLEKIQKGGAIASMEDISLKNVYPDADKIAHYVQNQVDEAAVLKPRQYKNEYEIFPFTLFTRSSIYQLELELLRQPEKMVGFHRDVSKDLNEVINSGMEIVNEGNSAKEFDFVEGIYRLQYQAGMEYELTFRSKINHTKAVQTVTLFRPFAPVHLVSKGERPSEEIVHVIVPLSGRGDAFKKFMDNFRKEAIQSDGHVHLTVVCYGDDALNDATAILDQIQKDTNFKAYQIISGKTGSFARGKALQEGTMYLPGQNPLMFFCDVDMFFTSHFLSQCRSKTKPGSQVFYPVVFSLYNPEIVYANAQIPSLRHQQIIKSDNGFWRDFGFGMTCQYKQDFNDIGGFDLTIKGWGSEDVLLNRKYTRSSKYKIIRTPVNSLFHHWHPKHCDKSLSLDQFNACLRTKSLTEGSQIQLGMLYLKDKQ